MANAALVPCQLVAIAMIILKWIGPTPNPFFQKHKLLSAVLIVMTAIGLFGSVL